MEKIKTYKDLLVYRKSLELLNEIYEVAYKIPHMKLRTQIINSSEAIPPIIAEGFSRKRNPKDSSRYYEMAMGESDETCVHLEKAIILSNRFPRIPKVACNKLIKEYNILAKQLNKLATIWRS